MRLPRVASIERSGHRRPLHRRSGGAAPGRRGRFRRRARRGALASRHAESPARRMAMKRSLASVVAALVLAAGAAALADDVPKAATAKSYTISITGVG